MPPAIEFTVLDKYFNFLYKRAFGLPSLLTRRVHDGLPDLEPSQCYMTACREMHRVKFLDLVPHDENRIADAADLANEFLKDYGPFSPLEQSDLLVKEASVFEVLVALAYRADNQIPLTPPVWFWIFLTNLDLGKYNDEYLMDHAIWPVHRIIRNFNGRNYKRNGRGGIFPLRRTQTNQRTVELWYQMGAYITDQKMY